MWTAIASVLLAAFLLVIGPFTFLPSLVGGMVAEGVQEDFGLAETPTVELVNDEAPLEMLLGRFTGGTVSMSDAVFGGVRTDSVVMDLDPFDVDARESIASRSLQSEDLRGDLRVEVSEEEVSRLAESRAGVPFEGVELSEGEMLVNTSVAVLGNEVPLTVRGGVGLEGRELSFLPGSIAIAGADLPQEAVREILGDLEVTFELEGFPRGADIQEARIEEGVIVLTGRMERLSPAGG